MEAMTENKVIPQLRFREFDDSLNSVQFGKVVKSNIYGPRFNANDYNPLGNVKTIRGTDVSLDGELKYSQVPIAKIEDKVVENHRLLDGDLVMITTADCGLTGVYRKQSIDYIASAYAVKISLNNNGYPYFFKYFFQTNIAKREIKGFIRKATVANLPGSDILRIKLHLPTLPEQQKIATFLSSVDAKLQQLSKKKSLLADYKKGVMQKIFSQELRFKDANGNKYPDWEEKKLGEVFSEIKDKVGKQKIETYSISAGIGFISQKEKFGKDISGNQNEKYIVLQPNEFSYNKGNSKKYKYGCVYLNRTGGQIAVPNVFISFKVIDDSMNQVFYEKLFEFHYLDKGLRRIISSSARMDGLLNINKKYFFELKICVPCSQEQQKIATFLSALDTKIEKVNTQINNTQAFKKGLLQQMFVAA